MSSIAHLRLWNQKINGSHLNTIEDTVSYFGAMQAQDYHMAKWAIGARIPGTTDAMVEQAIDNATIIRTHIMRPTWHFVAAKDLRWMMAVTAPHVQKILASSNRKIGLTDEICGKSNRLIAKMLEGRQLTREEIMTELGKAGIPTHGLFSVHLMFSAELESIVCNGPRRGKQFTYALVDERVPSTPPLHREEALATLALRYFTSHGPATLKDYCWWSGLTVANARAGLEAIKNQLVCEKLDGKEYWMTPTTSDEDIPDTSIHFLPAYDEFMVAYTDRSASLDSLFGKLTITGNGIFKPIIVVNGTVTGIWKRTLKKDIVCIEPTYFNKNEALDKGLAEEAVKPFGAFLGLAPSIQ